MDTYQCRYQKLSFLKKYRIALLTSIQVRILSRLRLAPAGLTEVHDMLYKVADSLCAGGETGQWNFSLVAHATSASSSYNP